MLSPGWVSEESKVVSLRAALVECARVSEDMNRVLGGLETKLRTLQTTLRPLQDATREVALAETNINKAMDEMGRVLEVHRVGCESREDAERRPLTLFDEEAFLIWVDSLNHGKLYFDEHRLATEQLAALAEVALSRMEQHISLVLERLRGAAKRAEGRCVALAVPAEWDTGELWEWAGVSEGRTGMFREVGEGWEDGEEHADVSASNPDFPLFISDALLSSLCQVCSKVETTAHVFGLADRVCDLLATGRGALLSGLVHSLSDECLCALQSGWPESATQHPLVLLSRLFAECLCLEREIALSALKHAEMGESDSVVAALMADTATPALRVVSARLSKFLSDSRAEVAPSLLRSLSSLPMGTPSPWSLLRSRLCSSFSESASLSARDPLLVRVDLVHWLRRVAGTVHSVCGALPEWDSVVRSVEADASRALADRVAHIRTHDTRDTRADGGTHPLSIDCAALMACIAEREWEPLCDELSEEKSADGYVAALRGALIHNLAEKSRHYASKEAVLQCVFELNNLDYVAKCGAPRLRKKVLSLKAKYLELAWGPLADLLRLKAAPKEKEALSAAPTRLRKRERNSVKSLFNSVNAALSQALSRHLVIPDPVLRADVCATTVEFVLPLYLDFWRMYADVHFTEHRDKYFKVDPASLEARLNTLFDAKI